MSEKTAYIDVHRAEFGVEPICHALEETPAQIAPSSYYAVKKRPPSERELRDRHLCEKIARIHENNYGVYGVRKIHAALRREGERVAESTVRSCDSSGCAVSHGQRAHGPRSQHQMLGDHWTS
jgi:putative transposase